MELNHLRAFFLVAKAGKFSVAANELNISQSALSRSVALLEERENVTLFERSKKGVTLTPKGYEVFRHCEVLFQKVKEIEDLCQGSIEKCEGPLRFATTDHILNDHLVDLIHKFRRQYPKVIPSISTGTPIEMTNSLFETENEFVLSFTKIVSPQLVFHKQIVEPMVLFCSPEIWKGCKSSTDQKTITNVIEKYGYLCSIGGLARARTSRLLMELFGEIPEIGLETNSQESQKRFCVAGEGVAYLARFMVKAEIAAGTLLEMPIEGNHELGMWLAHRKGHDLSFTARTFLDHAGMTLQ